MNQEIRIENHFNKRVVEIIFPNGFSIQSKEDIQTLKQKWQNNLKSWHTPYTCIFDLRNFNTDGFLNEFLKLISFFQKFHMRKIIGFKNVSSITPEVNFAIFDSYELACENSPLGRGVGLSRNLGSLRECISIENDFHAHVMEINVLAETILSTKDDILILKSKIKNILRQWHTPYSILINCVNLKFHDEAKNEFVKLEKFLKGFFCKEIIGYSPVDSKDNYPFQTFRSRHVAAGRLESIGAQAGDAASCAPKIKK